MALPVKSANKDALRKLMNERRNELKAKTKINSPIASYNSQGQLTCIICNLPIKSEALWNAHIAGRAHKEKALALKNKPSEINTPNNNTVGVKRKAETLDGKPKIAKVSEQPEQQEKDNNFTTEAIKSEQTPVPSVLTNYSSSSDEDESEDVEIQPSSVPSSSPQVMPEPAKQVPSETPVSAGPKSNSAKSLPEGFFDDPILDAKVRQVEYKDPMEEEWEKFQKTMAEEANLSQAIIEEDMQESNVEREIMEIDEQIHHWSKVEALLQKKDNLKKEKGKSEEENDESSSADEAQFDEFLDWRLKQAWKM